MARSALEYAADIARVLDNAEIPHVLFGWQYTGLLNGETTYDREVDFVIPIDFVVPDDLTESAVTTLEQAEFTRCTQANCEELRQYRRIQDSARSGTDGHYPYDPFPAAHYHIEPERYSLFVYQQTSMLWWMPELQPAHPDEANPGIDPRDTVSDFTFSNRVLSMLPPEPMSEGVSQLPQLYAIRVLKPSSFVEALIVLYARDYKNGWTTSWLHMIHCLKGLSRNPGEGGTELQRALENKAPMIKAVWEDLEPWFSLREIPSFIPVRQLHQYLQENNGLPPPGKSSAAGD